MPKLTIDGKEVEADASMNLIRAAELADIEIPHYCYHPGLSIPGNCRMCLVEIEKAPKLQIACNTRVAEGMVVHTTSDKAKAAQKAVLEFLLINHPIDCPVCDQAGECKLQDYYMDYDQQPSRFPLPEKNHKGKAIDIGSGVMLDQERCILCARCTRFFDEITKTSELAIFERGDHNRIDINPGQPVNNKYAGNVVDICPVGALTEKEFRFRMRVWYLHRTASVCGGCERGCAIDIHHHRGRIYRFKPRYNPGINDFWMCDEGRHSFPALQNETRLTSPLVQAKDQLVVEPWGEGIRRAASIIADYKRSNGPNSIAVVVDATSTNEEAFALKQLMKSVIGSDRIATLNWSPPGASGDDELLIRANKNPNTRGLAALGLSADGLDGLSAAVASGELKMLIAFRADLVRALGEDERPTAETKLCMAPYWNCYDNGVCCTGSMKIPQEKSVAAIDLWEESFFQSEFTHASGVRKHVRFRGGFLALWQSLSGQKAFPEKYLVKLPQTLAEFVRDDDHSYRNDNRQQD